MALGDPYVTLAEFKERMDIPATDVEDDQRITDAIGSASRQVEEHCKRQFNDSGSVSSRQFCVHSRSKLIIDDFSTVTGLVVNEGSITAGFTTTLTINTDFFVGPVNALRNETSEGTYWRIEAMEGQWFSRTSVREPNCQVSARWGWASVPEGVKEATHILAARIFRRADSPDGIIGNFEGAPIRVGWMMDPDAERMLKDFRKHVPGRF